MVPSSIILTAISLAGKLTSAQSFDHTFGESQGLSDSGPNLQFSVSDTLTDQHLNTGDSVPVSLYSQYYQHEISQYYQYYEQYYEEALLEYLNTFSPSSASSTQISQCKSQCDAAVAASLNGTNICDSHSLFRSSISGCLDCGWTVWGEYGTKLSAALQKCGLPSAPTGGVHPSSFDISTLIPTGIPNFPGISFSAIGISSLSIPTVIPSGLTLPAFNPSDIPIPTFNPSFYESISGDIVFTIPGLDLTFSGVSDFTFSVPSSDATLTVPEISATFSDHSNTATIPSPVQTPTSAGGSHTTFSGSLSPLSSSSSNLRSASSESMY